MPTAMTPSAASQKTGPSTPRATGPGMGSGYIPGRSTVDQVRTASRLTMKATPVRFDELESGADHRVFASLAVNCEPRPVALPATDQVAPPSSVRRTVPEPRVAWVRTSLF